MPDRVRRGGAPRGATSPRHELTAEERLRGSAREQLRGRLLTEIGVSIPTDRRKSA